MRNDKYLRTSLHVTEVDKYNELKELCDAQGYSMSQFINQMICELHPTIMEYNEFNVPMRLLRFKTAGSAKKKVL